MTCTMRRTVVEKEWRRMWAGLVCAGGLAAGLAGCAAPSPLTGSGSESFVAPDEQRQEFAHAERAIEVASIAEADVEPARPPVDAGALRLVEMLRASIDGRLGVPPGHVPGVYVGNIVNRSRAGAAEAGEMESRFASLLRRAGAARGPDGLEIVETEASADARVTGRAYLLIADGIEQWELWLTVCSEASPGTVWRNDEPIRMLRQKRHIGPQITRWPGSVPPVIRLSEGPE
jgi:hypothetical protein